MQCVLLISILCHFPPACTLDWENDWLTIHHEQVPGKILRIHYLEAYCRAHSTTADWVKETVVGHTTTLVKRSGDGRQIHLRCRVADGLIVDHVITANGDEIEFRLTAQNPTPQRSVAHWAQPCVRLGTFTGCDPATVKDEAAYLPKCFIFVKGQLQRLPTSPWATQARYVPGQVWCPRSVPRTDVNPRPLSEIIPSNGLIGCFSGNEKMIFATAWEPYQELFQGVARCLHSDFRLGGLGAGETLRIRGKIYLVSNDLPALLRRYAADFPEHFKLEH
jgi:hypothetical protein